jgi:hypothetical protein
MQQRIGLSATPDRHHQRIGDELRCHSGAHRPAHHAPGEEIDDGGYIEPPFRNLRGPIYVAAIADESALWLTENSANPDTEILNAVRPGLATTDGPLFGISSPYARRGELWRTYDRHFGPAGDPLILVVQGASLTFNPALPQSVVDRAFERDPASAAAQYGAEFRRDIENFVNLEAVRACVRPGTYERAPRRGVSYAGFVDPSGGSSDSMTLAIRHNDVGRQTVVVDALREVRPPFSPEAVVEEFSALSPEAHQPAVRPGAARSTRRQGQQIRSLVVYSGAAICVIIPCSTAPTLSNNIIQKELAFGRDWSGTVVNSGS